MPNRPFGATVPGFGAATSGIGLPKCGGVKGGAGCLFLYIRKAFLVRGVTGARAQGYVVGTWMENWLKGLKHAPIIYVCMSLEKCFNPSALVPNPLEIGGKVAEGLLKVRFLAKPK